MSGKANPKPSLHAFERDVPVVVPRQTRLLVVRHGQSEWNAFGRWQGQADPPLSDLGMNQAAEAALELGTFDSVWASDLQRAALTAAIIAEIVGIGPIQIDTRLRETDVGPWEGLTHAEVEAGWPGFIAEKKRPQGFEDYDHAARRMIDAFVDIAALAPGGEILVVSHGGTIRAVRSLLGATNERLANLSGCWFFVNSAARFESEDADRIEAGDHVSLIACEPATTAL